MTKKYLNENSGVVLYTQKQKEYELIDAGNGRKLERYKDIIINRPENQAIWKPMKSQKIWDKAHAIFTGNTEEEGMGRWKFPKGEMPETWEMKLNNIKLLARFTSFRHLGVFPEQAKHWETIEKIVKGNKSVKMLNLFGYTGIASLIAASAGAEVVHVDASKKAVGWARENQKIAKLEEKPIRWIIDDAIKFCKREVRRKKKYDVIVLDPPAYGRGPKGEKWQLLDDLPEMLELVEKLQSDNHKITILTCYAIRLSSFALHQIMKEKMGNKNGELTSGELVIKNEEQILSTSLYAQFGEKI